MPWWVGPAIGAAAAGMGAWGNSQDNEALTALKNFKSQAGEMLQDESFTQMRKHGYGQGWVNSMVRGSINQARPQILEKAEQAAQRLATGGFEFSGLQGRVEGQAVGQIAGAGQQAETAAWAENEKVKQSAEAQAMQAQMHLDNLEMQRLQAISGIESERKSWQDYILEGASLASNFMG